MRRPITAIIVSILAGFAFTTPVMASSYDTSAIRNSPGIKVQTPTFEEADQDANLYVSLSEARMAGVSASEATSADLDDDGLISPSEWEFVETDQQNLDALAERMDSDVFGDSENNERSVDHDERSFNNDEFRDNQNYQRMNEPGTERKVYD